MDDRSRKALDGLARAVAERPPEGPIVFVDEYRRALERVERLPCNRRGTDKTWTERALSTWTDAVAKARRMPSE